MKNLITSIGFLILLIFVPVFVYGQDIGLTPDFHKNRRQALKKKMPANSVAVLFSAPVRNWSNDVDYVYRPNSNFYYLTGWKEPHAVLLLFSELQNDEDGTFDEKIYVRDRDAYSEIWTGHRTGLEGASKMDFDRVAVKHSFIDDDHNFDEFDQILFFEFENDVRDTYDKSDLYDLINSFKEKINFPTEYDKQLYDLYRRISSVTPSNIEIIRSSINRTIDRKPELKENLILSEFLSVQENNFRGIKQNVKQLLESNKYDLNSLQNYLTELREIKLPIEIDLLKRAIRISAQGQIEVMKAINETMTEREVQGIHQMVYKKYGVAQEGYPSIVGAGNNGCVLHYTDNDKTDLKGQLILMDLGAEYEGYTADITRTIPVSGKFTPEQLELYEIVFEAQTAGIEHALAGNSFQDIYSACAEIIQDGLLRLGIISDRSDYRKYLPHGVSHHIGLDVHDPGKYQDLEPNMVITVEPGIYIPAGSHCDPKWWDIGIRIEDDILIRNEGPLNLSINVPKEWSDIEATMSLASPLDDFDLPPLQ